MTKKNWKYEINGIEGTGGFGNIENSKITEALKKLTKIAAKSSFSIKSVILKEV
jgi:hypothetical protein